VWGEGGTVLTPSTTPEGSRGLGARKESGKLGDVNENVGVCVGVGV